MFLSEEEIEEEPVPLGKTDLFGKILYYKKKNLKLFKNIKSQKVLV